MNSNVELIENFDVLWTKEDRLALALSGGVDSIVLFHLLVTKYRHTYKELVVFHINHGLRKESYEEAEFVEKFVSNYDIRFYKKELEMNSLARDKHISEEMLARELRYKAFNEMAAKENITKILTAHHKNDQVENILMRLLTGRSMDYNLVIDNKGRHGNLTIYRPLLNVLKETLEQYAQENNLKYYTDESNFDTDYTRNNIRHNIIPLLNDISTASFDNLINFAEYYKNINNDDLGPTGIGADGTKYPHHDEPVFIGQYYHYGVVGTAFFVALVFYMLFVSFKRYLSNNKFYIAIFGSILCTYIFRGLFETIYFTHLYVMLGLFIVFYAKTRSDL